MASFFLACGGLVFILSDEQITFAAMRRGMGKSFPLPIHETNTLTIPLTDDIMFIFNFAVAVTCFAFCWLMAIVAFKGWLNYRPRISSPTASRRKVLFDSDVHIA